MLKSIHTHFTGSAFSRFRQGSGIALAAMITVFLLGRVAEADTTEATWIGGTTNWSTIGNWGVGGVPSATVSAEFNTITTYTNQPTLTAASTAQGIWDTGASGGVTTTISGANTFTISGNATLDGIANAGILLDGAGNNNLTINNTVTSVAISNSTSFLVNNGGTLTIAAPLNLSSKVLTLGSTLSSGSGSIVISGAISGGGTLLLNDTAGTTSLILSGNNTYTAATTVTSGTLSLSGTLSGATAITINGTGGSFIESSTGLIGSTSSFTVLSGSAVLGGTNSYTGATTVSGGNLNVTGALGNTAVSVSGGTMSLQSGSAITQNTVTLSGSGILNETAANALSGTAKLTVSGVNSSANLSRANNYTGATTVTSGTLNLGAAGAVGAGTIAVNGVNGVLVESAANAISGTTSLTISGGGTAILSQANTFSGTTGVTNGTLQLSSTGALANSALSFTSAAAATLQLRLDTSGTFATSGAIVVPGGGSAFLTIDVNQLTSSGSNNQLSLGTISFGSNNTGSINVTGGNGDSLGIGTLSLTSSVTLNPTTANMTVLSATAASTTSPGLTLGGTSSGNVLVSFVANPGHTSGLAKQNTSTWTLTGSSNLGGGVLTVANGTLALNFGASGAPATNIVNSASLSLGGGTLNIIGGSGSNSQTFTSTALTAGASKVSATQGGASPLNLILGSLGTRPIGATVDFVLPGTSGSFTTTTTNSATTILGGWATVSGTTWAVTGAAGTNAITGLAAGSYTNDTWATANDTTVTTSSAVASGTTNSLRFNAAGANTITLTGSNRITSGGILVTNNVGNNLSTITSGTLVGANGKDLVIIQNNTSAGLTIGSVIANNTTATGLTKSGAGLLTLANTANTYTGATYLNGGITNISADASLGAAPGAAVATQLNFNGGTLQFASSFNLATTRGITLLANGGTIDLQGNSTTYGGIIVGSAGTGSLTILNNGGLTLSGVNTFTGGLVITNGTLSGNTSSAAFGTGAITLGVAGGSSNVTLDAGSSLAFANAINLAAGNSGTMRITSSASSGTFSGAIALNNDNLTLVPASANSLTLSGSISGSGGLIINAPGSTVSLRGSSTFTGGILLNSGTLTTNGSTTVAGNAATVGPLGTGTLTLANNTGFSNENANVVLVNSVVLTGTNYTFGGTGFTIFDKKNGGSALNIPTTVSVVAGQNWVMTNNGVTEFADDINFTPSGGTSLTVSGAGKMALSGNNDFGGGAVVINSGATLQLGYANFSGFGGSQVTTPTMTNVANWQVNAGGVLIYTAGNSLGNGTITLNGGTLDLSNNGTAIATNTIIVTGNNSTLLATGGPTAVANFGSLTISASSLLVASNGAGGSQGYVLTGSSELDNSVTINVAATASGTSRMYIYFQGGLGDDSSSSHLARSLTITGTGSVAANQGSAILGGTGTYTGTTSIINGGVINLASSTALPDTALFIDSTGLLDMNAGRSGYNKNVSNANIAGLSGAGTVTNFSSAFGDTGNVNAGQSILTLDDPGAAAIYTFSGTITDGFSANADKLFLVKSGNSTQILTGANTYVGSTTINGGVLQAQDGTGLPTASALIFGSGSNTGGVLQGNGTFNRSLGSGTVAGTVSWTGTSNGGFAAKGGTFTVNLNNNGGNLVWGSTANFVGAGQSLVFGSLTADSLVNFVNGITLAPGNNTVQVNDNPGSTSDLAQLSGVISGTTGANLVKTGSGTLILAGTNTYLGSTNINQGTLSVSNVTAGTSNLGNATSAINLGSGGSLQGTFEYTGTSATLSRGFVLTGPGQIQTDVAGQTLTITGGINENSNTLTFTGSGNTAISTGGISGAGNNSTGSIVKNGSGQVTLNGINTYGNATTINQGTLSVTDLGSGGAADSLGDASQAGNVLTINGGTLQYIGTGGSTDRTFGIGANGATLDASGSGAINFNNNTVVSGPDSTSTTLTLTGTNTGQNILAATIYDPSTTGSTSVVKNGTGTWVLTGGNNYSGRTTINNGVLQVNVLDVIGSSQPLGLADTIVLGGSNTTGTLEYTGGMSTLYQNINVGAGNGVIKNTGGDVLTLSGTLNKANATLTLSSGTFNITGQITGGTTSDFNSDFGVNGATVTVSSTNNNYTGPTVVYGGGTLLNGADDVLPVGTVLTTGTAGETSVTNTYKLNGFNQTIGALNSAGGGTNIVSNGASSGVSTLTLSGTNSANVAVNGNFAGSIQDGGAGALAVTVLSGTQTLSGNNTYTGVTTVKGGVLALGSAGSIGGSSKIIVGDTFAHNGAKFDVSAVSGGFHVVSSQTLAGHGTVIGSVTVDSGAHLAPGNGQVGTLTVGSLTLSGGSILDYEFNGSANDITAVTGALTVNAGAVGINLYQEGGTSQFATAGTYDLFSYGTLAGSVSNLSVLNQQSGYTYNFGTATVGGTNYVTLTIASGTGGATSTNYTLTASASSTNILTGATTSISSVIQNTGSGTADTLNYTGLSGTSSSGGTVTGSSSSGGPLAQGASGTNAGLVFTGTHSGVVTVTPTITGSATNATAGGNATQTGTSSVTVNVFDPASLSGAQSGTGTVVALTALNQSGTFRASAKVTADNGLSNNQGFTDVAVAPGTQIDPGNSVTVASFDKTNRLNGTYTATKSLGYDNVTSSGSAITGGTGNTANVGLSVTVSGQTAGAGQTFNATLFSGQKYGTTTGSTSSGYGLTSNIAGDPHSGTTATLINGTASANTTVSMSFNTVPSAGAIHDTTFRTSDILSLGGIVATGTLGPDHSILTDKYVLQMSYDPSAVGAQYIGWYDADQSQWVNAIAGNSTGAGLYDGSGEFAGSYAAYLATLTGPQQADLAFQLNAFGYDVSTHTAWAVLNHNSEFAVIPEPSTWGMILSGFGMLIGIQRLRRRRVGI